MTRSTPVRRPPVRRPTAKLLTTSLAGVLVLGALSFASVSTCYARGSIRQTKSWGIGVTGAFKGGNGLSFKTKMGRRFALQAYAGLSGLTSTRAGHVGADLLLEMHKIAGGRVLELAWNVGVGAATTLGSGGGRWFRGVFGLELLFRPLPIELVFEWGPVFGSGGFGVDHVGTHLRWWF